MPFSARSWKMVFVALGVHNGDGPPLPFKSGGFFFERSSRDMLTALAL